MEVLQLQHQLLQVPQLIVAEVKDLKELEAAEASLERTDVVVLWLADGQA